MKSADMGDGKKRSGEPDKSGRGKYNRTKRAKKSQDGNEIKEEAVSVKQERVEESQSTGNTQSGYTQEQLHQLYGKFF